MPLCDGSYYYNIGLSLMKENRISDSLKNLKKARQFGDSGSDCSNLLGLCLFCLGRFGEARNEWETSIAMNSSSDNPAHLYTAYIKEKEFDDICMAYNKALEYAEEGNYKKAVRLFQNSNLLKLNCVSFQNVYGLCLYAMGERKRAQEVWIKSLKIDSSNADTLYYLSNIEYREAKGIFKRIAEMMRSKE